MNQQTSLDMKTLLGVIVLTVCAPVFSQNNPYYTRLRIVNSNNDTSLSEIMMTTDQTTTLYVQGKRSDNGEWNNVWAKWEILDSTLTWLDPMPPASANSWHFGGLDYCYGRVRVTLGKDSICEPDTIRIEIRPGCGPMEGDITFLTPLTHVESGDTITAVIRISLPGYSAGLPYCMSLASWCSPDSSGGSIRYFDTLTAGIWPAPVVITGEGSAQMGAWGGAGVPVKECLTNGMDTVKFVFCPGTHKVFVSFNAYYFTSPSFQVYARAGCPCGMSLEIRPHNDTTIGFGDSLRFEALILDDTAGIHHEYDTLLAWSMVHNGNGGRLRAVTGSANTFYSDSGTGLYRIVVTCTDVSKFPASWPLLNRSDTVRVTVAGSSGAVKRPPQKISARTIGKAIEFFNLRGQKLPLYGIKHTDGILIERVIEPTGKISVRKKFQAPK